MRKPRTGILAVAISCVSLALCACGGEKERRTRADSTCDGKLPGTTYINVWFHVSGSLEAERKTLRAQVDAFNGSQQDVQVKLVTLPEGDYSNQVRAAAANGGLPDVLDFDGPNLYNYAWSGKLKPLDSCVPRRLLDDLLPSIRQQGTYAGRLWGVGTFDSGLGLYVRPSILRETGARIPTGPDDAWTADELTEILPDSGAPATAGRWTSSSTTRPPAEWPAYGFSPAVWSAGGDLIDRPSTARLTAS